jgi:hypothetical protein
MSNCSGGGGGGGGSGGSQLPSVALKADDIRILQSGDSWTYSITGTLWDNSSGSTYNVTGTQDTQVLSATKSSPTGSVCQIQFSSTSITVNNKTYPSVDYEYGTQDAFGNYFDNGYGDGSTDMWMTTPAEGFAKSGSSPVVIGDSISNNVIYNNGDTETSTSSVIGKEYAATGIANYESYKISEIITTNYASGTYTKQVQTSTFWVVPGIGQFVRASINQKNYIGTTLDQELNGTFTLTNTNVSY